MKRFFSVVLTLLLVLSSAACEKASETSLKIGNKQNEVREDLKEYIIDSKAVIDSMPQELKNTKLTYLNWYDTKDHEENELFENFKKMTGIEITTRVAAYNGYIDTVAGLLAAGETPDFMRMRDPEIASFKLLQDINEATGFDFSGKEWDDHIISAWSCGKKCYGVNLVYTPYMLGNVIVYDKSTMKKMGYEDPWQLWLKGEWTWEKMKEMCINWVEQGTDYIGAVVWPKEAPVVTADNSGFIKRNPNGTYKLDLMNQKTLDKWKFIMEGRAANLVTNDGNDAVDRSNQTTLFGSMTSSVVQGRTVDYFPKMRKKGNFAVVPIPKWENETYCMPMYEFTAFGIPKAAKNPKAVPYLLAYMCNLDNYDLSVYDKKTNPTGYFYDEQCKDVYMEMLTIRNRQTPSAGAMEQAYNQMHTSIGWLLFMKVDSSQINTWIQTKQPIMQSSIDAYNKEIMQYN